MMRPDAKVEKVYLYSKPVDFRKSIDGLAALVERNRSINPTSNADSLGWSENCVLASSAEPYTVPRFSTRDLASGQWTARNMWHINSPLPI